MKRSSNDTARTNTAENALNLFHLLIKIGHRFESITTTFDVKFVNMFTGVLLATMME